MVRALADAIGQPLSDIEAWANERVLTVDADGLPEWDQSWLDNMLAEIVGVRLDQLAALRALLQSGGVGGLSFGRISSIDSDSVDIVVQILGESRERTVSARARSLDLTTIATDDLVMVGRLGDRLVLVDAVETVTVTPNSNVTLVLQEPPGAAACSLAGDLVTLEWVSGVTGGVRTDLVQCPGPFTWAVPDYGNRRSASAGSGTLCASMAVGDTSGVFPVGAAGSLYGHVPHPSMPDQIIEDIEVFAASGYTPNYAVVGGELVRLDLVQSHSDWGNLRRTVHDVPEGQAPGVVEALISGATPASETRLRLARGSATISGVGIPAGTKILLESDTLTLADMSALAEHTVVVRGVALVVGTLLGDDTSGDFTRVFFGGTVPAGLSCDSFDLVSS